VTGVLDKIVEAKRAHIAERKAATSIGDLENAAAKASPVRSFAKALENSVAATGSGLIAEIKKASPSKGLIREDFDPPSLARAYAAGGATCLSVLTDVQFFQGSDAFLGAAREAVNLPGLRKDFMIDPFQIVESRALGADCVLIILAVLDDTFAAELADTATQYGMDTLVEVHDEGELERAAKLDASLIGINNRNLDTLAIDIATTERLAPLAPPGAALVGESGLYTNADLGRMHDAGVHRFLVGESLMRERDVTAATAALLGIAQAKAS
jgi:indole-3-glycerol phosphate synthase